MRSLRIPVPPEYPANVILSPWQVATRFAAFFYRLLASEPHKLRLLYTPLSVRSHLSVAPCHEAPTPPPAHHPSTSPPLCAQSDSSGRGRGSGGAFRRKRAAGGGGDGAGGAAAGGGSGPPSPLSSCATSTLAAGPRLDLDGYRAEGVEDIHTLILRLGEDGVRLALDSVYSHARGDGSILVAAVGVARTVSPLHGNPLSPEHGGPPAGGAEAVDRSETSDRWAEAAPGSTFIELFLLQRSAAIGAGYFIMSSMLHIVHSNPLPGSMLELLAIDSRQSMRGAGEVAVRQGEGGGQEGARSLAGAPLEGCQGHGFPAGSGEWSGSVDRSGGKSRKAKAKGMAGSSLREGKGAKSTKGGSTEAEASTPEAHARALVEAWDKAQEAKMERDSLLLQLSQLTATAADADALREELAAVRAQLTDTEAARDQALAEQQLMEDLKESQRSAVALVERQVGSLQAQLAHKEQARRELSDAAEAAERQVQALREEAMRLRAEDAPRVAAAKQAAEEAVAARLALAESQAAQQVAEERARKAKELSSRMARSLKERQDELRTAQQRVDHKEALLLRVEADNVRLSRELQELARARTGAGSRGSRSEEVAKKITDLDAIGLSLGKEMKELRAATGRLEKEKVVLKMEASRAMEAHVQSAALASILASRLETLESTLACVARDTAAAAAVRAHAVQAGEVAVAETSWTSPGFGCHAGLGGGRAEVARLEDALHNLGRERDEARKAEREWRELADKTKQQVADLRRQCKAAVGGEAEAAARATDLHARVGMLERSLARAEKEKALAEEHLAMAEEALHDDIRESREREARRIDEIQATEESWQDDKAALELEVERLRQQVTLCLGEDRE